MARYFFISQLHQSLCELSVRICGGWPPRPRTVLAAGWPRYQRRPLYAATTSPAPLRPAALYHADCQDATLVICDTANQVRHRPADAVPRCTTATNYFIRGIMNTKLYCLARAAVNVFLVWRQKSSSGNPPTLAAAQATTLLSPCSPRT